MFTLYRVISIKSILFGQAYRSEERQTSQHYARPIKITVELAKFNFVTLKYICKILMKLIFYQFHICSKFILISIFD